MSKAERTKQFIIEKTAPIFNAKGYAGTSLNDMIHATGLTKGSIYGNFENKDEVALAAFDHNFGRVITYMKAEMKQRQGVIAEMLVYPETYRNFLNLPFLQAGCPILNTSTEADDTHPLLREKAANAIQYWQQSLERQLKRGIENGEIKAEVNCSSFASVFISLVQGGIMQAKVTGKTEPLLESMDFLENMIKQLKN